MSSFGPFGCGALVGQIGLTGTPFVVLKDLCEIFFGHLGAMLSFCWGIDWLDWP